MAYIHVNNDKKRAYYSELKVVKKYEKLRFQNPGGQYVHQNESMLFMNYLERCSDRESVLDIPVGTGRMMPHIHTLGFKSVSAADYSQAMIERCRANLPNDDCNLTQQDIYKTTYPEKSFSAILVSRFFFHSDTQDELFIEMSRILRPRGIFVFDTLTWSPRKWTRLFSKKLGGNIYTNSHKSIKKLADNYQFEILSEESLFMLPSFIYNFLPKFILDVVISLEKVWPKALRTKRVWLLRKR